MKMLLLKLSFMSILASLIVGCDNIPRDRPTIETGTTGVSGSSSGGTTTPTLPIPERPTGAIIIQADHCGCKNGEPISIGNCASICAEKQSTGENNPQLFFNIELTPAITLDDTFKDLQGFCSNEITDPNTNQPVASGVSCALEFKDENGNVQTQQFTPSPGATSFTEPLSLIDPNKTYRVTIVETTSGARSTTIQVRTTSTTITDNVGGPLGLMPVNQYACMLTNTSVDPQTGEVFHNDINRFHFYFIPNTRPEPLQASTINTVFCHDKEQNPTPINSPLLEESTGVFTVWNTLDPRFFDQDANDGVDVMRVNELIQQNVELQGQTLSSTPNLFFPLQWPSGFDDGNANPNGDEGQQATIQTINSTLGYYMTPFLDDQTFKAYCPTQAHYYSDSPLFKAMKDIVGVDTEGIYAAKQDNVCDFILIKESLLKNIWFYKEGGQHIKPTSDTIQGKKIQFYWPADTQYPYIKKSHQRIYTLKASNEISCESAPTVTPGGQNSGGVPRNYPPHDKRIGCIPKILD